jgi:hypothetical protein
MDLYCEIHDGRQGLEMWRLYLVVILMYTDGFELPVTEVQQSFYLINKGTDNVRIQYPYKTAGKITLDYILIFKFLDSEGN